MSLIEPRVGEGFRQNGEQTAASAAYRVPSFPNDYGTCARDSFCVRRRFDLSLPAVLLPYDPSLHDSRW